MHVSPKRDETRAHAPPQRSSERCPHETGLARSETAPGAVIRMSTSWSHRELGRETDSKHLSAWSPSSSARTCATLAHRALTQAETQTESSESNSRLGKFDSRGANAPMPVGWGFRTGATCEDDEAQQSPPATIGEDRGLPSNRDPFRQAGRDFREEFRWVLLQRPSDRVEFENVEDAVAPFVFCDPGLVLFETVRQLGLGEARALTSVNQGVDHRYVCFGMK